MPSRRRNLRKTTRVFGRCLRRWSAGVVLWRWTAGGVLFLRTRRRRAVPDLGRPFCFDGITSRRPTATARDVDPPSEYPRGTPRRGRDPPTNGFRRRWDADAILDQIDGETAGEFDFTAEAARMDAAAATLAKPPPGRLRFLRRLFYTPPVAVPRARAGLVTKRLLVMDFVSGIQLSRLAGEAGAKGSDAEAKMLFEHLGDAFGRLLFEDGFAGVHADPHPGNLLVRRRGLGAGVGLVDWGQTKGVSLGLRLRLARVVAALGAPGGADDVRAAIEQLGVAWNSTRSEADQTAACVATAVEWCDTRPLPAPFEADPTSEHYALTVFGELTAFPVGLIYYLRATQYRRRAELGGTKLVFDDVCSVGMMPALVPFGIST